MTTESEIKKQEGVRIHRVPFSCGKEVEDMLRSISLRINANIMIRGKLLIAAGKLLLYMRIPFNEVKLIEWIVNRYLNVDVKFKSKALADKVRLLDLSKVADHPDVESLSSVTKNLNDERFIYFKRYGNRVFYFSEEYLLNTPNRQLIAKSLKNYLWFT